MSDLAVNWKQRLVRHWQSFVRGLDTIERILRGSETPAIANATDFDQEMGLPLRRVLLVVLIAAPIYGFGMGSFASLSGDRWWSEQWLQMMYSAMKVPILIALTLIISLPSFFVINSLFGLRSQFRESLKAIVSAQAGMAIVLVSLLPITLFVYVSISSQPNGYSRCVMFNTFVFGFASVSAQILLRKYYQPLIASNPRQRIMIRLWIFIYAFVGIQAAYVLRPFVGSPRSEISFFRNEPFENAYVVIFKMVWNQIRQW